MLAPVRAQLSSDVVAAARQAPATTVPFFAQIKIVNTLVYLGLVLGTAADAISCRLAPSLK
eukprot:8816026-Pyramimonas_sp.AAC.1